MNIYDAYDRRLREAWKGEVTDEDGNPIVGQIVPDNGVVRVPLKFMDGKSVKEPPAPFQHADRRPREVPITDAERERRQKAVADYNRKVSDAWRQGAVGD